MNRIDSALGSAVGSDVARGNSSDWESGSLEMSQRRTNRQPEDDV